MSSLELDNTPPTPKARMTTLSAPGAEVISRLWQAIAFLEEVRSDLTGRVRQSPARDAASVALVSGTQQLIMAAGILAPKITQPERAHATADASRAKAQTA